MLKQLIDRQLESPPSLRPPPSAGLLLALNRSGKHIYGGTVPPAVIARRRAANRVARASRRTNRKAAR